MSDPTFPPESPTKSGKNSPPMFPKGLITPKGYGLGYKPDTHDKSKDPNVRALLGATMRMPTDYSLEQYTQIYNQLQTSSCTGWAFAQVIKERCAIAGADIPLPSPEALYVFGRALARQQAGHTPEDAPLEDQGAQPSLIVQGMAQWGAPSNLVWPFDPSTINDEPEMAQLEYAAQFLVAHCTRVSSTGSGRLLDIRQAIASGYPVAIGTSVDQAFEDYAGGKQKNGQPKCVSAPDPKNILGGHMMHLVGYTAEGLFRGVNQWGTSWGDGGYYWADESFVTTDLMTDIYVLACNASGH
jgi:hypothetical protein